MPLKMRITNIEQVQEPEVDDQGQPTGNLKPREGELRLTAEFFDAKRPATVLLKARHSFEIKPDQTADGAWDYMMEIMLKSARRHFHARTLFAERTTRMQDERDL